MTSKAETPDSHESGLRIRFKRLVARLGAPYAYQLDESPVALHQAAPYLQACTVLDEAIAALEDQLLEATDCYASAQAGSDLAKLQLPLGGITSGDAYSKLRNARKCFELVRALENKLATARHLRSLQAALEKEAIKRDNSLLHAMQVESARRIKLKKLDAAAERQQLLVQYLRAQVGKDAFRAACEAADLKARD